MSKRVNLIPIAKDNPKMIYKQVGLGTKFGGNKKTVTAGIFSPLKFLRRIGAEMTRELRSFSGAGKRSSRRVSSASLARSCSYAEPLDCYRAEAIEDCIEFLNSSSSSMQRSSSVTASSCYSFLPTGGKNFV